MLTCQEIGKLRNLVDISKMEKEIVLREMVQFVNLIIALSRSQRDKNVFTNKHADISNIVFSITLKVKKLKTGRQIKRKFQKFAIIISKAWPVRDLNAHFIIQ